MSKQSNGSKNSRARTWIFIVLAIVVIVVGRNFDHKKA